MTMWDGLFQGIIQGATEFLPVSSDGHLTLYQHLTGNSGQGALFFNLMLHLGTLLAVFLFYYKDIWQLICVFFKMLGEVFTGKFHFKTQDENRRMIYMLFLACLPLLGFVLLKDWVTMITEDDDIVVVFSHGGVINVVLHELLGTARLLSFPVDYVSVTRLLYARSGQGTVAAVNSTEHVWDLLPRNRR